MKRWLAATLALGLAAAAGYVLLVGAPRPRGVAPGHAAVSAPAPGPAAPRDHIDEHSRAALQQILRENESEPGGPR